LDFQQILNFEFVGSITVGRAPKTNKPALVVDSDTGNDRPVMVAGEADAQGSGLTRLKVETNGINVMIEDLSKEPESWIEVLPPPTTYVNASLEADPEYGPMISISPTVIGEPVKTTQRLKILVDVESVCAINGEAIREDPVDVQAIEVDWSVARTWTTEAQPVPVFVREKVGVGSEDKSPTIIIGTEHDDFPLKHLGRGDGVLIPTALSSRPILTTVPRLGTW
jgi:hypothetical protein